MFDPEAALDPGAPTVHPDRAADGRHANLLAERRLERGDVEHAFRDAAVVVDATYRTGHVEHAFLAPESGLALPSPDGGLILHVATQWPEEDLRQAAAALGEPLDRLTLVQDTIGGAFGGREDISIQLLLLLAARACGAPVRMVWDRTESIRGHGKRHPFRIRHRLAADAEGRFLAATADLLLDAGCYTSTSVQLLRTVLTQAFGPYEIPACRAVGRAVYTNNPFTCAFRGFGVNQVVFAMEQQVNRVAEALGRDPADLRLANLSPGATAMATGCEVSGWRGLERTIARATETARVHSLPAATGALLYGRGMATAIKNIGYGFGWDDAATAEVTLSATGARVRIGAAEVGQGVETVLTQIAATTLGLPADRIQVEWRSTALSPEAGSTSASRQTTVSGHAVREACIRAAAALEARGGLDGCPGGSITARGTWRLPETTADDEGPGRPIAMFGSSTSVADVSVDARTGEVRVLRVVQAVDAGRIINPLLLRGQVEGGIVMGQGYALLERLDLAEGMPTTLGFETCGVPTAVDAVPWIETIFVEEPEEAADPLGTRGVGEVTMISVVPAITAAIHAACGAWIDRLPASPSRVLRALRADDALRARPGP